MRIGKIFGIDLIINVSWLFIFALVAWSLASPGGPLYNLSIPASERTALGIIAALLLFASVLAHELSHSLVSLALGIRVSRITLYIFGGVSQMQGSARTPGAEALITIAGPLMSFVIAAVAAPIERVLGPQTSGGAVAQYLSIANFALGVFNLLPAIPLDGGRVFHAALWHFTKDTKRATEIAASVSRVIAGAIMAFGIIATLTNGFGGGLWLVLIGWFIWQAGSAERTSAEVVDLFTGKKAIDLAAPPPEAIPADASVQSAMERLLRTGRNAAPVMLGDRLLGIVTLSDFLKDREQSPESTPVTAVMTRTENLTSALPTADALEIIRLMGENGYRQIPLIDEAGQLQGFITRDGVMARIAMHHS